MPFRKTRLSGLDADPNPRGHTGGSETPERTGNLRLRKAPPHIPRTKQTPLSKAEASLPGRQSSPSTVTQRPTSTEERVPGARTRGQCAGGKRVRRAEGSAGRTRGEFPAPRGGTGPGAVPGHQAPPRIWTSTGGTPPEQDSETGLPLGSLTEGSFSSVMRSTNRSRHPETRAPARGTRTPGRRRRGGCGGGADAEPAVRRRSRRKHRRGKSVHLSLQITKPAGHGRRMPERHPQGPRGNWLPG